MPASFDSLPDELLSDVFDRLAALVDKDGLDRHDELIQMARVCKRWKPLVIPRAWEILKFHSPLTPTAQIKHLLAHPQLLVHVRTIYQDRASRMESLTGVPSREHCTHAPEIVELFRLCPSLSRIDICIVKLEQEVLSAFADSPSAPHIKGLTLTAIIKNADSIAPFLHHLANLRSLTSLNLTWASPTIAYQAPKEAFAGDKVKVGCLQLQPLLGQYEHPAVMLRFLNDVFDSEALHIISLRCWRGHPDFIDAAVMCRNLKTLVLGIDQLKMEPAQLGTSLLALVKLSSVTDMILRLDGGTGTEIKCPIHLGALLDSMPRSLRLASFNCLIVGYQEADGVPKLELAGTGGVPVYGLVFLQVAPLGEEVQEQQLSKVTFARIKVDGIFHWRRLPADGGDAHGPGNAHDQHAVSSEMRAGSGEAGEPDEATTAPA